MRQKTAKIALPQILLALICKIHYHFSGPRVTRTAWALTTTATDRCRRRSLLPRPACTIKPGISIAIITLPLLTGTDVRPNPSRKLRRQQKSGVYRNICPVQNKVKQTCVAARCQQAVSPHRLGMCRGGFFYLPALPGCSPIRYTPAP